ncbi:pre-tRNA nuclear export protein [Puccinia graminis f. sp. tritici]|uniref:Exportin-T n=1 Tax=Puccinia graminis f. sp. tritici TaxID=56615 RepID=A0A5B0QYI7_PUCGR|nr:pre-tRNA nuclear export protein [Puccinia graminis f. sp. tritici]
MASLDEQIHQAVLAALNPGPLQSEGLHFLQQLRSNPKDSWQPGLICFLAGSQNEQQQDPNQAWSYKYPPQTRLFGLQLVDTMLQLPTSSEEEIGLVKSCYETTRQQLWDYIHREFVEGPGEQGLGYLRNKVVQTLFLLFFQSYPNNWPDFFSSFADLIRQHPKASTPLNNSNQPLNPRTTDLYLRLLHEISSELSDALLRINKPAFRLTRDAELRDAIRERDAERIARETFGIVAESLEGLSKNDLNPNQGLYGKQAQECLEMGIRVVEDYASWIDISLIVTPTWIPFLFQSLRLSNIGIRLAAADALICIVTKGMPAANRIQLYNLLGLVDVLKTLKTENNARRQSGEWSDEEDQFNERLARILNGMGVELCKVCDDSSVPLEFQAASLGLATQLLPLLISFVEEDVFASCASVLPFSSAILSRYKKDKKLSPDSHLNQEKRTFLSQLLRLIVIKVRYPPDDLFQWEPPALPGETEDEDMVVYHDRRRQLKTIIEAIAVIDETLFQETIDPLISNVLDHIISEGGNACNVCWQEIELALVMLYNYGEAVRGSGPTSFRSYVMIPPEEIKKHNKNKDYKINYSQYPLSSLGNLLLKASKALTTKFPHPSIAVQWFECVTRYHEFFEIFTGAIQDVLPTFLDDRGLHNSDFNIRYRCCYLFYRFVLQGKPAIQTHFHPHDWQAIIDQLQDLIVIEAELPNRTVSNGSGDEHDILMKAVQSSSVLDSQLYLFEAVGILVSFFSANPEQQIVCLQSILEPLITQMRTELKNRPLDPTDLTNALKIHHSIMAVGAIAKGFPNLSSNTSSSTTFPWLQVFKTATDDIMRVTERLNDIRVLRDATRSSFHKIVATIGMEALPHVPVLINCLLDKLTKPELVEFLSFVGQLVHKYKENFISLLDSLLLPLFSKIINFLDQPITGTDDVMCQSELRRGYFNLCNSIIGAQMHGIFVSPNNQPHLETILKTIIDQLQAKEVLIPDLRFGFGLLKNFSSIWLKAPQAGPSPVPGFELFLYHQVAPLCFAIPCKPGFDWSDAESYLVLTEIIGILKMLMTTRGGEFVEFLVGNLFPSMSCPPEKGQKLIKEIQETTDLKPSRKPLVEFFGRNAK